MDKTKDICYIDGKEYLLSDVEKMGIDNFSISAHIHPYKSLFKYYPNTTKYIQEEKKERNYSFEALENNTVFLQDAENFDDCFDCAVDLDWDKFLSLRANTYCEYFNVDVKSNNINDIIHALSLKLYKLGTMEKCIELVSSIPDEAQRLHGQKRKITNAYNVLRNALKSSIGDIFYLHNLENENELSEKELSKFADYLTKTRGTIAHGGLIENFTDEQAQIIMFLEILTYCQILKRANIDDNDIELIIGAIFGCNQILFNKCYNS